MANEYDEDCQEKGGASLACPGCSAARKRCAADPGPRWFEMGPGSAEQREERCTASGTRKSSRRRLQQPFRRGPCLGGDLRARQHSRDFLAAVIGGERIDPGGDALALVERVL